MARRSENECAYCAEEIDFARAFVGKDWKTYCSEPCLRAGEEMSQQELETLLRVARVSRTRLTWPRMKVAT